MLSKLWAIQVNTSDHGNFSRYLDRDTYETVNNLSSGFNLGSQIAVFARVQSRIHEFKEFTRMPTGVYYLQLWDSYRKLISMINSSVIGDPSFAIAWNETVGYNNSNCTFLSQWLTGVRRILSPNKYRQWQRSFLK